MEKENNTNAKIMGGLVLLGAIVGAYFLLKEDKSDKNLGGIKYYKVSYQKKKGGQGQVIVKGQNEKEAKNNATFLRATGKNFEVVEEVEKQPTEKGAGRNRMN